MDLLKDLKLGAERYYLWLYLGWRDVYRRYLRSFLGPSWLFINSLVLVSVMGPLYSFLFKIPMENYLGYMITSVLTWQTVAQIFNDIPSVYINNSGFITDVNLPFSVYHMQMLWRNLVIYGNSLIIILPVTFFSHLLNLQSFLLFPVNLLLVVLNGLFASYLIAGIGTRFRDIAPIMASIIQIAFFATPIIWKKEMLGPHYYLTYFNPFFHMLEMLRAPFLGYVPDAISYIVLSVTALIGFLLTFVSYRRIQTRVAYWL